MAILLQISVPSSVSSYMSLMAIYETKIFSVPKLIIFNFTFKIYVQRTLWSLIVLSSIIQVVYNYDKRTRTLAY